MRRPRARTDHLARKPLMVWLVIVMVIGALALTCDVYARQPAQSATPTPVPTLTYVPGPVRGSVVVERDVYPPTLEPGREATVELQVSGQSVDGCQGIPGRPVDMMVVFDISASAGAGLGSNWERTVKLTQALMDHLARPIYRRASAAPESSRVALVSSQTGTLGPEPVLLQPLTDDYDLLRSQVTGLAPGGDTDLAGGLRMAAEELAKTKNDRAQAVTIMLHDNTALDESTKKAVREVQGQDIPVYLVTNSLNVPDEKQITLDIAIQAVSNEQVYLDPEPETLLELFIDATEGDSGSAAADIQVVEKFTPPGTVQVFEVNSPSGRIESDRVVWDLTDVSFDETVELSYRLRLAPDASRSVNITGGMVWLDCNGYPQSTVVGALIGMMPGPTNTPQVVEVQEATLETPTGTSAAPTGTQAPTKSSTPIPTSTPESGVLLIPALSGVPSWIWWLLLLLLLLALLAFLWWLLHRPEEKQPEPPPRRPEKREEVAIDLLEEGLEGIGITYDWRVPVERITDRQGRSLGMRIRPKAENVEQKLAKGQSVKLVMRVEEGDREVGRVEMVIEVEEETNPLTGETERQRRVWLNILEVPKKDDRRCGVETIMLERAEKLAREHEAHEIYGSLDSEYIQPFFEQGGYRVRQIPRGGYKVFKALGESK